MVSYQVQGPNIIIFFSLVFLQFSLITNYINNFQSSLGGKHHQYFIEAIFTNFNTFIF